MDRQLNVAFLWHMHQPTYRDLLQTSNAGVYPVPWVRVHALRSELQIYLLRLFLWGLGAVLPWRSPEGATYIVCRRLLHDPSALSKGRGDAA
jgi:hypothetical protein